MQQFKLGDKIRIRTADGLEKGQFVRLREGLELVPAPDILGNGVTGEIGVSEPFMLNDVPYCAVTPEFFQGWYRLIRLNMPVRWGVGWDILEGVWKVFAAHEAESIDLAYKSDVFNSRDEAEATARNLSELLHL